MTIVTVKNAKIGMYVHEAGMLGNLHVQQIDSVDTILDSPSVHTHYLVPYNRHTTNSYSLEGRYHHRDLSIIEDPVAFIQGHWLSEQAFGIMKNDVNGLGQQIYNKCAWYCAKRILEGWRQTSQWKETINGKRWLLKDYLSPDGLAIRERRGWSKKDHLFNGDVYWSVVGRQEYRRLVECIRTTDYWFDDTRYWDAVSS